MLQKYVETSILVQIFYMGSIGMTSFLEVLQPGQTVLGRAHNFVGAEQRRFLIAGNGEQVVVGVIDTQILLRDIRHAVQRAKPLTILMQAVRFGGLRLFASTTVRDEVWEKLNIAEITTQMQVDPSEAKERWMYTYLPWITFLDPADLPPLSGRVVELQTRDPDDVPAGQIIELIRPDVVFSDDRKHLGSFDIIGDEWFAAALAYCAISKREGVIVSLKVGGGVAVQGTVVVAQCSFTCLAKIDAEAWRGILLLLMIALALFAIALAIPSSRRWLQTQARSFTSFSRKCAETVRECVGGAADEVAKIEQASLEAKQALSQMKQRAITPPRKVLEYAAMVLARSPGSLTPSEIVQRMQKYGYQTDAEHPEYYLSRVLHAHPHLFEKKDGQWSFKSHQALPDIQ